jgi:paraquat-inducible protein A
VPPWIAPAFRMIAVARPWVMLDVYLLAVIVTFARLASTDEAYAGAGLYGLGAYVLLRAMALQAYEPDEVWRRVDELDGVPARSIEDVEGARP